MCDGQQLECKCEEGVEGTVGKFDISDKEKEEERGREEERIDNAKRKVKLWLTNNFGEPESIELMVPAR